MSTRYEQLEEQVDSLIKQKFIPKEQLTSILHSTTPNSNKANQAKTTDLSGAASDQEHLTAKRNLKTRKLSPQEIFARLEAAALKR